MQFVLQSDTRISAEQGFGVKVDLEEMTTRGLYIVPQTVTYFITTASVPPSQVLGPPELECTWITEQVFCPSTASLKP